MQSLKSVECQIAEQHANGLQEIISSWAASSRMRRGDAPLPIEYKLLEYEAARKAA
jgi:hypothetical protein